jgi:hypothetical protein
LKLTDWLHTFGVHSRTGDEYCIICPACKRPKLYFNIRKRIGHCHFDKCIYHIRAASLDELNKFTRYTITNDEIPLETFQDGPGEPISLPPESSPLVYKEHGVIETVFPIASEAVSVRGVAPDLQYKYNLYFDGYRVYIPVYSKGELVSYVGRAAWWYQNNISRYKYPLHTKISHYLFNWDNLVNSEILTLVENSYNAINYNHNTKFNVSTNFGSYLSKEQINLLLVSKVKLVCLLWDGGSEKSAAKACSKLRSNGIECIYGVLPGKKQPDNFTVLEVNNMISDMVSAGFEGVTRLDFI